MAAKAKAKTKAKRGMHHWTVLSNGQEIDVVASDFRTHENGAIAFLDDDGVPLRAFSASGWTSVMRVEALH